jgi:four helix bundle protein
MAKRIVYEKSELFSDRIIKMHKYLLRKKCSFDMADQILRFGTSVAANLAEAEFATS